MADHIKIGDISPRVQYTGNGAQTDFLFGFPIFIEADLEVYEGAVLKSITTDYTITGAGLSTGGTVTFVSAPANAAVVTLVRNIPVRRLGDFDYGEFRANVVNDELDTLTATQQEAEANLGRALRMGTTDSAGSTIIPDRSVRSGKVLGFDGNGDPVASTATLADIEGAVAANGGLYNAVQEKSAAYSVVLSDQGNLIKVDATTAPVTITLPALATLGADSRFAISKVDAGTNAVTVQRSGTDTINGATALTLTGQYELSEIIGDASTGFWTAVTANVASTALNYQGVWNAATNTPAIVSGIGAQGHYHVVGTLGTTTVDGFTDWQVGDWIVYNGATWDKIDNNEPAATATLSGVVELATDAEAATGTDTTRALTPANAASVYSPITRTGNGQIGVAYTLVLADAGKVITMANAAANTLTIPPIASAAFPVGTQIDVIMKGAGVTSVTGGAGVTLNGVVTGSGAIDAQYKGVTILHDATDAWIMVGAHGVVA